MTSASSSIDSPASTPVRRPSQATATSASSATPSAARGWRSLVMSESNCSEPPLKPSWSAVGSKATAPPATSSGPACRRSPGGSRGASPRAMTRTTPSPSLTTHARRAAHGPGTGSWPTARPPSHTSPSGRYGSRTKNPPTTASCTPDERHQTSSRRVPGKKAPARACARGHGERRRPSSSRRRRARGARAGTRSHGPYFPAPAAPQPPRKAGASAARCGRRSRHRALTSRVTRARMQAMSDEPWRRSATDLQTAIRRRELSAARGHAGAPRADRGGQPRAQRDRHARRGQALERPQAADAARAASGSVRSTACRSRSRISWTPPDPDDVRLAALPRPRPGGRQPLVARLSARRRDRDRQDEHARVRRRLADLQHGLRRTRNPYDPRARPAAAAAAPRSRSPRGCCRSPTAPTSAAASATRRSSATSSASDRRRAAFPAADAGDVWDPCRCSGRWPAPSTTPALLLRRDGGPRPARAAVARDRRTPSQSAPRRFVRGCAFAWSRDLGGLPSSPRCRVLERARAARGARLRRRGRRAGSLRGRRGLRGAARLGFAQALAPARHRGAIVQGHGCHGTSSAGCALTRRAIAPRAGLAGRGVRRDLRCSSATTRSRCPTARWPRSRVELEWVREIAGVRWRSTSSGCARAPGSR